MSCSNFVGWQGAFIGNLLYKLWFECCVYLDTSGTGKKVRLTVLVLIHYIKDQNPLTSSADGTWGYADVRDLPIMN